RRRAQRSRRAERKLRGLGAADKLNACRGQDADLIGAVGDRLDVHETGQVIDGVVALVLQRRRRRIVWTQALQLGIERGDRLQVVVGLIYRRPDVLLDIGAQRLDALRRYIE